MWDIARVKNSAIVYPFSTTVSRFNQERAAATVIEVTGTGSKMKWFCVGLDQSIRILPAHHVAFLSVIVSEKIVCGLMCLRILLLSRNFIPIQLHLLSSAVISWIKIASHFLLQRSMILHLTLRISPMVHTRLAVNCMYTLSKTMWSNGVCTTFYQ